MYWMVNTRDIFWQINRVKKKDSNYSKCELTSDRQHYQICRQFDFRKEI